MDSNLLALGVEAARVKAPKILHFDIETSPLEGYIWGLWDQSISPMSQLKKDWNILCFSAIWEHKPGKVISRDLTQDRKLKRMKKKDWWEDDYYIARDLGKLFSEADILVAQNGDRFDIPKTNARLLYHSLPVPTPYRTVDTLKIARSRFKITSNKLDFIAQFLGLEGKIGTTFELWRRCVEGPDRVRALREMATYCRQDTQVLREVALRLWRWQKNPPNLLIDSDKRLGHCPRCAARITSRTKWTGRHVTKTRSYPVLRCNNCGGLSRSLMTEVPKAMREVVLVGL